VRERERMRENERENEIENERENEREREREREAKILKLIIRQIRSLGQTDTGNEFSAEKSRND
jgi:hypothetical protein